MTNLETDEDRSMTSSYRKIRRREGRYVLLRDNLESQEPKVECVESFAVHKSGRCVGRMSYRLTRTRLRPPRRSSSYQTQPVRTMQPVPPASLTTAQLGFGQQGSGCSNDLRLNSVLLNLVEQSTIADIQVNCCPSAVPARGRERFLD
jgi:hypothetical protein